MTRISFDFHQTILEIQFKIMINFVQFFALIFIISEFEKIQKNTQKNVNESLTKKSDIFSEKLDFFVRFTIASAAQKKLKKRHQIIKKVGNVWILC